MVGVIWGPACSYWTLFVEPFSVTEIRASLLACFLWELTSIGNKGLYSNELLYFCSRINFFFWILSPFPRTITAPSSFSSLDPAGLLFIRILRLVKVTLFTLRCVKSCLCRYHWVEFVWVISYAREWLIPGERRHCYARNLIHMGNDGWVEIKGLVMGLVMGVSGNSLGMW